MVESRDYSSLAERASRYRKQKSLGQCFLIDESIHEQIVQSASLDKDSDVVLEIGASFLAGVVGFLYPAYQSFKALESSCNGEAYF